MPHPQALFFRNQVEQKLSPQIFARLTQINQGILNVSDLRSSAKIRG
jgi:hypothetical protein